MKVWTVRAKRHINSQIPEGYTVRVKSENAYDWNELYRAIKEDLGISLSGVLTKDYWDWN